MLRLRLRRRRSGFRSFNPRPAFRPDASVKVRHNLSHLGLFQSSSGLSTRCYLMRRLMWHRSTVFQSSSGLSTGCFARTSPSAGWTPTFQSSSGLSTGCFNEIGAGNFQVLTLFQSSSGLSTGCYTRSRLCSSPLGLDSFNPHPAFRPDATATMDVLRRLEQVSILIRPFDRMLRQYQGTSHRR